MFLYQSFQFSSLKYLIIGNKVNQISLSSVLYNHLFTEGTLCQCSSTLHFKTVVKFSILL